LRWAADAPAGTAAQAAAHATKTRVAIPRRAINATSD
jgi:hypothetical protein